MSEIEYLGADAIVTCRFAGTMLTARVRGTEAPRRDARVRLGWRRSAMHIFDGDTGRRLDPAGGRRSPPTDRDRPRREGNLQMKTFVRALLGAALAATALAGPAAAATEISFYYPVAVGGPITKIIDGYAADFEKENPDIEVKPVYTGSYQEIDRQGDDGGASAGNAAATSPCSLSTDMFTLIDEDMIVPYDEHRHAKPRTAAWLGGFYPALHGEQPGRRPHLGHPVPALDHRPVLQQGCLQGGRPRPREGAGHLGRAGRRRQEADQKRRLRQRHAMGRSRSRRRASRTGCSRRSPIQNGAELANQDGTKVNFNGPKVVEALQFFGST